MAVQLCNTWYVVYVFIILAHPIIRMISYISCTSGWFRWFTDAIEDLPHSRHQDRHKKTASGELIISFKTATRGVALKNAWQLFATKLHHPEMATFKIWGKNGGTKTGSIGLGSKDVVSLALSLSLFRVQHVLKSKPLSGTSHPRSQYYMNHHEPICSNLSWKKISPPVQCPALPPWYPSGFGMDLGPFYAAGHKKVNS